MVAVLDACRHGAFSWLGGNGCLLAFVFRSRRRGRRDDRCAGMMLGLHVGAMPYRPYPTPAPPCAHRALDCSCARAVPKGNVLGALKVV